MFLCLILSIQDDNMKLSVVLLFSLCTFQLSWGEIRTAGRVIPLLSKGISGRAVLPISSICNTPDNVGKQFCDGDPICDSTAVVYCTSPTAGYNITCPEEKRYCTKSASGIATCTPTPAEGCVASTPPFQCTGVGNYPDPSNCRIYYNCYKKNDEIIAEALTCSQGYVFDPNSASKQFCLYTSTPSKCVTVTVCDGQTMKNVLLPYTNNAQFVALCVPGTTRPLIFQCPTGTKANLDDLPATCTFVCKSEGQFEYTPDKNYYYECRYDTAKKLYSTLKPCPGGHVFEKTVCVRL